MKKDDLAELSADDLWRLHEEITELSRKIHAERRLLEVKLARLQRISTLAGPASAQRKRKYPRVAQKYQNPNDPTQTWSGRGKQPIWVSHLLATGMVLEDLSAPDAKPGQ